MKKFIDVMLEKALCFGQRPVAPLSHEVENNGTDNGPVGGRIRFVKGGIVLRQDYIFNRMQPIFNVPMLANA